LGIVYDPDRVVVRYAHESQSSSHNPTVYDVRRLPTRTVVYSLALSTQNPGWNWQLDNRTGVGYDYVERTYFLPDYNGDLSYADDNIVEIDAAGNILNAWETDDEVNSNDSSDGSEIDSIIDIAVVPGDPTRYFVVAAYDDNVVYEVDLQRTGTWWTPNSWHTVATCTVPLLDYNDDNLGIDYDAKNMVLYHSNWHTTTVVVSDLTCEGGTAMNLVGAFDCPGAGGYNSGVTFVEGSNPPEVWVTDFSSDQTTRCKALGAESPTPGWDKRVDGTSWTPDLAITKETWDTFQVTDVITAGNSFTLTEFWDAGHLSLTAVTIDPPLVGVVTATEALTVTGGTSTPEVVTVTKHFLTLPSTWTETVVTEALEVNHPTDPLSEERPFTVTKTAPQLSITSDYHSQVFAGGVTTFTLTYANTGGFENDVTITNTFPVTAPLVFADPQPDGMGADGSWARWDVGGLATGEGGAIVVYVYISETLSAGTVITIWDGIYNHVGGVADEVETVFEVLSEAATGWTKTVDDGSGPLSWSPRISITKETYETFTVTDVIDVNETFLLVEGWITSELSLADWSVEPAAYETSLASSIVVEPGSLTFNATPNGPDPSLTLPVTLTKVFTVESCSWPQTVLWEQLSFGTNTLFRPLLIHKDAPVLELRADNPDPEIHGGELVTYTLAYSNTGGYENALGVRTDFPAEAPFAWSNPAPTTGTAGALTAEWAFTDGLAMGGRGAITVTAQITSEVPPGTAFVITNTLLDHVGVPKDVAFVTYATSPPQWQKWVNDVEWSSTQRTSVVAGDVVTVTETITTQAAFQEVDRWPADHLTLLGATPSDGSVSIASGVLTWTVPATAPETVTVVKRFLVELSDTPNSVLWEALHVGGVEWERRPIFLERAKPDLRLTKTVTPSVAAPGEQITYTLTFSNAGPGPAAGVVITDRIPVSVTVTAVLSSGARITDTGVTPPYVWQVEDLAASEGGVITVAGTLIHPLDPGLVSNVAEMTALNEEVERGNTPGTNASKGITASAYLAVDGPPLVCDLNVPGAGTYPFCNGICGSVTFTETGSVSNVVITFTQRYPSINGEGLPRQYQIDADGSGFSATLTLCYEDAELEIAGIPAEDEGLLLGFRYETPGGYWDAPWDQRGDGRANTIAIGGLTQFSAWGIGVPEQDEPTALRSRWARGRSGVALLATLGGVLLALEVARRRRRR
jgi:uncharacterized repeat protein (TIGR01451 family)